MSAPRWTRVDAPPWVWMVGVYAMAVALTPLVIGAVPATPVGWIIVAIAAPVVFVGGVLLPEVIGEGVVLLYRWAVVDGWRNEGGPGADSLPLRLLYVASRVALVTAPLVLAGWLLVHIGPSIGDALDAAGAWLDPHFGSPADLFD